MSDYERAENKLKRVIDEYEKLTETLESELELDGHQLKDALSSQIPLEYKWFPIKSDARALRTFAYNQQQEAYYSALNSELNNSYRKRSITEARELAKSSIEYRNWTFMYNEADDIHSDIKEVIEIIQSRRYVLNNTTNAFVSSVQNNSI